MGRRSSPSCLSQALSRLLNARRFVKSLFCVSTVLCGYLFMAQRDARSQIVRRTTPVASSSSETPSEPASMPLIGAVNVSDESFFRIDPALGQWDASRMFKLYPNVVVGTEFAALSSKFGVTLATQVRD